MVTKTYEFEYSYDATTGRPIRIYSFGYLKRVEEDEIIGAVVIITTLDESLQRGRRYFKQYEDESYARDDIKYIISQSERRDFLSFLRSIGFRRLKTSRSYRLLGKRRTE